MTAPGPSAFDADASHPAPATSGPETGTQTALTAAPPTSPRALVAGETTKQVLAEPTGHPH
ncbi:hypothetical protein [Yinghuangia soli]|uniref:Uncharacterized protein n=1 Tax=Yinghuangia soli TaxID=2908204 RepID=A0AA41PXT9_9ACTN|nr:hypothetical protein [Yinghuangia soli]MCF2527196.1 hypothetical protein [Yinghuangia soli]